MTKDDGDRYAQRQRHADHPDDEFGPMKGTADHLSDMQQHVGRGRIGEPPLRDLVLFDLRADTREPWHFRNGNARSAAGFFTSDLSTQLELPRRTDSRISSMTNLGKATAGASCFAVAESAGKLSRAGERVICLGDKRNLNRVTAMRMVVAAQS
jgi:hypothetical protein